jgi:hypothetical protein
MNLLAAEQRGLKMEKYSLNRRKRRGINPNTSSPAPLLLKEKGMGVEVEKLNAKKNDG